MGELIPNFGRLIWRKRGIILWRVLVARLVFDTVMLLVLEL